MARIQKNLLLTPNDIAKFQKLAEKAQQITIDNLKKDEDYEDAPDEFIGKFFDRKHSTVSRTVTSKLMFISAERTKQMEQ